MTVRYNTQVTGVDCADSPSAWDINKAYAEGQKVSWFLIIAEAISNIPKNTDWTWQPTADVGQDKTYSWKPVFHSGYTWRGLYSDANTYAVNDVVAGAPQGRLFICLEAMGTAGGINNPYTGTNRGRWATVQNSAGYWFNGATGTDKGTQGLVPVPQAKQDNAPLMGDGAFGLNVRSPANNADGLQGNICFDSNFLYIWTGDTEVKRIPLNSF